MQVNGAFHSIEKSCVIKDLYLHLTSQNLNTLTRRSQSGEVIYRWPCTSPKTRLLGYWQASDGSPWRYDALNLTQVSADGGEVDVDVLQLTNL